MDDTPAVQENAEPTEEQTSGDNDKTKRLSNEYIDADTTVHPFNLSNVTVVEKEQAEFDVTACNTKTHSSYDGSDSGVEVIETTEDGYVLKRTLSTNSQDFHTIIPTNSCDSSIISCCSIYEEAYGLIARTNSSHLDDFKQRNGDGTSEGGSESSSVAGSTSSRNSKTPGASNAKRRSTSSTKSKSTTASRSRSKTPVATPNSRVQSVIDRLHDKTPNVKSNSAKTAKAKGLSLTCGKPENSTSKKKAVTTPTNDGRWPSINSKPAPLMTRSLRGILPNDLPKTVAVTEPPIEKSATLPRRRREQSTGNAKRSCSRPMSRENSAKKILFKTKASRESIVSQVKRKSSVKIKIYHEIGSQTALTVNDVEKMLSGVAITPTNPEEHEKIDKDIQVELVDTERLQEEHRILSEKYDILLKDMEQEIEKHKLTEERCELLEKELNKTLSLQRVILQQHQELEVESAELEEFSKAEQNTLRDSLRDAENEISCLRLRLQQKDEDLRNKEEECKQKSQENLRLQAHLIAVEAKTKELLKNKEATAALYAVISRLGGLVSELVSSYDISEQELEESVFHNEAYSNSSSSPEATPEKSKFSKDVGSSFVSAVIHAIKNAAANSLFSNRSRRSSADNTNAGVMLESETEPTLMMEHVLEDVVIPDGYSHNMVSSGLSIMSSRSSLNDNYDLASSSSPVNFSAPSLLVDQVIEVDNIITRLLKVIRIIQLENDECMNDMQIERDSLRVELDKEREANKTLSQERGDLEVFCLRLKTEVQELMHRLNIKNNECDAIKEELNRKRTDIEKLNQDVCELSTALAKVGDETRMSDEEVCKVAIARHAGCIA